MKKPIRPTSPNVSTKKHGAHSCSLCRTPFHDFSMVYHISKGLRGAVGSCCVEKLGDISPGIGQIYRRLPLKPHSPAPWVYLDFTYFLLHPERSHRVRPAFDMEYPELGIAMGAKVVVRHIEQESYVKVLLNSTFSKHISNDESYLYLIAQLALNNKNDEELICEDVRDYKISV
jgi:hypothetical protein